MKNIRSKSKKEYILTVSLFLTVVGVVFLIPESILAEQKSLADLSKNTGSMAHTQNLNKIFIHSETKPQITEPADIVDHIPLIKDIKSMIPKKLLLGKHEIKLNSNRLVIQHLFSTAMNKTADKKSIITFSYSGINFGNVVYGNLDIPLCYSTIDSISGWQRYEPGNYTMTLSMNNSGEEMFFIKAITTF